MESFRQISVVLCAFVSVVFASSLTHAEDLAYKVSDLGTLEGSESFGIAIAPSPRTINVIDIGMDASTVDGEVRGNGRYSVVSCQQPFELTDEKAYQFFGGGGGRVVAFDFEFGGSRWRLSDVEAFDEIPINARMGPSGTRQVVQPGWVTTEVVGWARTSSPSLDRAFVYRGGQLLDLGTLGGTSSRAYGINTFGAIVGAAATSSGAEHPVFFDSGSARDLGTLGGPTGQANAVNANFPVVGFADRADGTSHPFSTGRTSARSEDRTAPRMTSTLPAKLS